MIYRIRDWKSIYENNRTRELKHMDWVPIPNKMDGDGYTQLVDHPNAAAHFGAWIAIVEICSRQKVRGVLPQQGATIPHPHAGIPQALARISRLPCKLFEEVLPRLLEIGWIEQLSEIPQEGAGKSQEGAEIPQVPAEPSRDTRAVTEQNRTEGKGTEQNGTLRAGAPTVRDMGRQFAHWWDLWSSIRGTNHRQQAENFYIRLVPFDLEEACLQCTASYLQSLSDPAKGYNPENFISEQSSEKFTARWPTRASPKANGRADSLGDRTKALWRERIAKGERPI